jgi:methyl-accepting chemotaxis protein
MSELPIEQPSPSHTISEEQERILMEQGWVAPDQVKTYKAIIDLLCAGQYFSVPQAFDDVSQGLRKLAGVIGRQESSCLKRMVNMSMTVNNAYVAGAYLYRNASDADDRSQTIAAATEELTASVGDISNNAQAAAKDSQNVREAATNSMMAAQDAMHKMNRIQETITQASMAVQDLQNTAEKISEITTSITEIAFQTNILAINASVEAASAGEAGHGFAIVAQEVKSLADKTSRASSDIANRIKAVTENAARINTSMENVIDSAKEGSEAITAIDEQTKGISTHAENTSDRINTIADILAQQTEASQEVAQGVVEIANMNSQTRSSVSDTLDALDIISEIGKQQIDCMAPHALPKKILHMAKSDHLLWRKNVAGRIINRVTLDSNELSDHHTCRLGKWYDNITDQDILAHPAYQDMQAPHADVHKYGKLSVESCDKGNLNGALQYLEAMEQPSLEVLDLLDQLIAST